MIPQDFIQSLLARVDIVDVVDRYVKLKKAGSNFSACCPFHNEKTPSFTVSPSKQFYHCFGCGAHGNAIGFLMEYSGQSYPEAIRSLAESVGLQVPETRERQEKRENQAPGLAERMNKALDYYRAQLKASPAAVAYLKGRGLSGEIAARYGLGYAPDGWQNLEAVFDDYASGPLKDTGLVIDKEPEEGKPGRRYDRFRDRVMFPILDARGNVIGFGGRVIGEGEPKYLNSPETPLFEKGRELYGLYQARRAIRDASQVIVVEGYMDVVALAQLGVDNAVATLGTATTPVHVSKLLRMADHVVFCFDGDAAGRKAAWRALEVSLPVLADGKVVSFLFLPPEDDPDTYVRREGKAAFLKAVADAKPLSQFLLSELAARVDMDTDEGRARFLAQAKPLVAQIEAPALAAMLRHRLAELARLADGEVEQLIPSKAPPRPSAQRPAARTPRKAVSLEARLLATVLHRPALAARIPKDVLEAGKGPLFQTLSAVTHFFAEDPARTFAQASAYFEGTEHAGAIAEFHHDPLLNQADSPDLDIQAEVDGLVGKLRSEVFARRSQELLQRVDAGLASPEEEAEFARLLKWLEVAKSGNPAPEERPNL